jgi:hypothetical protein
LFCDSWYSLPLLVFANVGRLTNKTFANVGRLTSNFLFLRRSPDLCISVTFIPLFYRLVSSPNSKKSFLSNSLLFVEIHTFTLSYTNRQPTASQKVFPGGR